jgi:hypothetical protein
MDSAPRPRSTQIFLPFSSNLESDDHVPDKVILHLANEIYSDCMAISFIWEEMIIELPEVSLEEFGERQMALPESIEGFRSPSVITMDRCLGMRG